MADIDEAKDRWDAGAPRSTDGTPTQRAFDSYEDMRQRTETSCNDFDDAYLATPAIGDVPAADSIRGEMCRLMVRFIEGNLAEFEKSRL